MTFYMTCLLYRFSPLCIISWVFRSREVMKDSSQTIQVWFSCCFDTSLFTVSNNNMYRNYQCNFFFQDFYSLVWVLTPENIFFKINQMFPIECFQVKPGWFDPYYLSIKCAWHWVLFFLSLTDSLFNWPCYKNRKAKYNYIWYLIQD